MPEILNTLAGRENFIRLCYRFSVQRSTSAAILTPSPRFLGHLVTTASWEYYLKKEQRQSVQCQGANGVKPKQRRESFENDFVTVPHIFIVSPSFSKQRKGVIIILKAQSCCSCLYSISGCAEKMSKIANISDLRAYRNNSNLDSK